MPLLYDLRAQRNKLNIPSMEKLLKNVACFPANASHRADSTAEMNGILPIYSSWHSINLANNSLKFAC